MVFYDDAWKGRFGRRAVKRLGAIMALVDEIYSEKDTLKTKLDVNVVGIEHAKGERWAGEKWLPEPFWAKLKNIADKSAKETNLYIFTSAAHFHSLEIIIIIFSTIFCISVVRPASLVSRICCPTFFRIVCIDTFYQGYRKDK